MFVQRLYTRDYNRISQNGIHELEIDFSKDIQIILGSNGSGKSSIKELLSPLPPNSADFGAAGRFEFRCFDRGSVYDIVSDYSKDGGHYFAKDGEVLNDYGTALVQRSLIQQHFNLNPASFSVICGSDKFTDMNPTQRRDWVMRLSNINIDPLMQRFMIAKERQRDAKGYMTKVAERLKVEERNKLEESYVLEKQQQLKTLKDEFNYYSEFSVETKSSQNKDLNYLYQSIDDFIHQIVDSVPQVPSWLIARGVTSKADLPRLVSEYSQRVGFISEQLDASLKDLKEINKIAEAKALLSHQGIDEIESKINQLSLSVAEFDTKLNAFDYRIDDPYVAKVDFLRIFSEFKTILFELPTNTDFKFNSVELNAARAMEESLYTRLTQIKESIFKREHQVKHIDQSDDITCPDCNVVFKVGISASDKPVLLQEITNYRIQQTEVEGLIKNVQSFITDCSAFVQQIREIYNIMKLTPSNEGLWKKVRAYELFKNPVFPVIEMLDEHLNYLEIACERQSTVDLLGKEKDILHKARESLDVIKESSDASVAVIDEKIFNLTEQKNQLNRDIEYIKMMDVRFKKIDENIVRLNQMFEDFNLILFTDLDNMRANFIRETKYDIMKEINFVEQELEQATVRNTIYLDVEKQFEKAKQEYNDYCVIVEKLSPNTGLIAKIMNDVITVFVDNLNSVINSVWTSDFKVLPCINKRNDLDWKFPVEVANGIRRSDIAKTSTSQGDIINFAFQLIVAKHIGASNYPLYIDELGSSMDDQHRLNLMRVISELIESKQCCQLFIISHFATLHEQFANNETFVVNNQNIIDMPRTYNQHVRIN